MKKSAKILEREDIKKVLDDENSLFDLYIFLEIAESLNMEKEDVVLALDSSKLPVSLFECMDDPKGGDGKTELIEKIPSDEREEDMVDKILLRSLIEKLPPREKKIIIMRYYRDNTQSEIAEELGASQVQVSRIENKIINSLKSQI